MDYPFYEELCRRRHPAATWWLAGDRLYYLGLLPAMMGVAGVVASAPWLLLGLDPFEGDGRRLAVIFFLSLAAAVIGPPVWLVGGYLKRVAHDWAKRDGIREEDWWEGR
jgi:hypothetical protein